MFILKIRAIMQNCKLVYKKLSYVFYNTHMPVNSVHIASRQITGKYKGAYGETNLTGWFKSEFLSHV